MLFSPILIAAALFAHSSFSLSVPGTSLLGPQGASLQRRADQPIRKILAPACETLKKKKSDIQKRAEDHDAQALISIDLQVFFVTFQEAITNAKSCNCASKEAVDLEWYKETVLELFVSVQVVIDVIFGTKNKSLILQVLDLCETINIHISNLIDISIHIDVEVAVLIRDNVDALDFAYLRIDIVELINNKTANQTSGSEPLKGIPPSNNSTL